MPEGHGPPATTRSRVAPGPSGPPEIRGSINRLGVIAVYAVPVMLKMLLANTSWPSGFVMVRLLSPGLTFAVERLSVMWVGSVKVTLFTVTPPDTAAVRRL